MPQNSMTQDLDPRFSVFLNPIRDLTKNWEVDIAKYLEEYLEELSEVQITFNGGETVMNFAQAAMLIQGSATVYSKKVEFLWQMVLQMLDLLASRVAAESRGGPGVGGKESVGAGKAALEISMEFSSVDSITEGRSINLRDQDEDFDNRKRSLRFLPATPLHLVEKGGEKAKKRVSLQVRGSEVFGGKDDFRLSRSYLTPQAMLCLEVPTEMLHNGHAGSDLAHSPTPDPLPQNEEHRDNGDGRDNGEDRVERESTSSEPLAPTAGLALPPSEPQPEEPPGGEEDDVQPPPDLDLVGEDVEGEEQERMSVEEEEGSEKRDKSKDDPPNNNNLTVIDLPNGRYGLRRRGEKEMVATLKLTELWKPLDPHAETPAKRPVRTARLRRPPACACHRPSRTLDRRKNGKGKVESEVDKRKKKSLPSVEAFITGELAGTVSSSTNKDSEVPAELLDEVNREAAKRAEVGRNRRARDLIESGAGRDMDEALQKVTEDDELQERIGRQLDDPLDCNGVEDLDFEGDGDLAAPPLFLPEPHDTTQVPEVVNKRFSDSQFDEPASDYEALVQKWVSDYITSAQEHVNSSDLARRVNKWRENIMPILQEEEARQEFDIHNYGTKVLSHFPDNGRKQTIPFSAIVCGQEPREASRLFLSCLMLANTHNIELSESCPDDLAMDCLELTLLSRVRHHEELQDYYAPSETLTPRRKGSGKGRTGSVVAAAAVCADITQVSLAKHNLPLKDSHTRAKAKIRPR